MSVSKGFGDFQNLVGQSFQDLQAVNRRNQSQLPVFMKVAKTRNHFKVEL